MRFKKIIAGALTFAIIAGTVLQINAETPIVASKSAEMLLSEENMEISGTNSFGNMVARELAAVSDEREANNGCNIFSVEVSGTTARVSFETLYDSALVVAIYDNEGAQMITSGYKEVTAEETETKLEISGTIPQYFYIRAYLVNPDTLRPLCTEYSSPMYTREMQEFLSKTVYDFDPERVLNLDDDPNTNFAVFNEETRVISEDSEVNVLVSADDVTNTYVFENPDDNITTLKAGDILAFENNEELIILETVSLTVDKKTGNATVVGQDAELEDVFEHLRIDGESKTEDAAIDDSDLEDGVTYEGLVPDEDEVGISPQAVDIGGKTAFSAKYQFGKSGDEYKDKTFNAKYNFSASLEFKLEASANVYISWSETYFELKLDYSAKLSAEFKGTLKRNSIPLAHFEICPVTGVMLRLTPAIVFEFNGSSEIDGKLSGTVGFKASTKGSKNLTTTPKFSLNGESKITFFIGVSLEPDLVILHKKIAESKLKAELGAEIKVTAVKMSTEAEKDILHECESCIDGDISAKFNVTASIKLLNKDKWTFKFDILDKKVKLGDFYISLTYGTAGFTECPHVRYPVDVYVSGGYPSKVENAAITVDNDNTTIFTTDADGMARIWLSVGKHSLRIEAEKYKTKTADVDMSKGKEKLKVNLEYTDEEIASVLLGGILDEFKEGSSDPIDVDYGRVWDLKVRQVSLGVQDSAAITFDGSLYMWGYNGKDIPTKVMDNVYSINGHYAITNDGILYRLEHKLGENVPVKIMDNVVSVSLGDTHSAAITSDGGLYMWGSNYHGQLGDGTDTNKNIPIKVMDNVISVSLGYNHSAAITTDGSLYTWGYNNEGQLGDGTNISRNTPMKIMDNVSLVNLFYHSSAAITIDGSLYTWGNNQNASLGDGTRKHRNTPVKIMNNVSSVNLTNNFGCSAITTDRVLYTWGGILDDYTMKDKGLPVKTMNNVFSVEGAGSYNAAITTNGSLYMWGHNSNGELGDGTTADQSIPVNIMDSIMSVNLSGSMWGNFSAAITTDGELYMWGSNNYGQLGNGTSENSLVPVKVNFPTGGETNTPNSTEIPTPYYSTPYTSVSSTITSLLPHEIYNIYSVNSRTVNKELASKNLLYIGQAVSDSSGTLTIPQAAQNGTVFVKAMHEFDVYNAPITSAEVNNTSVYLEWKPLEGASEYEVYCYTTDGILSQTKTTTTSLNINNLEKGKYYGFLVTSIIHGEQSVPAINDVVMVLIDNSMIGDVNTDNKVNDQDSILLDRHLAEWGNTIDISAADMNGDGKVNDQDSIILARTLAGWYN